MEESPAPILGRMTSAMPRREWHVAISGCIARSLPNDDSSGRGVACRLACVDARNQWCLGFVGIKKESARIVVMHCARAFVDIPPTSPW
eukprot:11207694-Lingulodinium_polyedra.AAC.1